MNPTAASLDLARLDKVRDHASGKITARCPACAEEDRDRTGNHLAIFSDGRFACVAHPGDGGHRKRIFALVGISTEHPDNTCGRHEWLERRTRERNQEDQRTALVSAARSKLRSIIERYQWPPSDVWHDSPQRIDCDLVATDSGYFLASLFPASAVLWTGNVHDSGKTRHSTHWKTCVEWTETTDPMGPMTTPAIWHPGTISRSGGNVLAAPFTVLDFDGFDGIKPATRSELNRHILDSLALIRWLREGMDWQLAAVLWTGGKSLHAWFDTPPSEVLQSLTNVATALGMDASLLGRPEHPCRLPGQRHVGTGNISRVLWLKSSP